MGERNKCVTNVSEGKIHQQNSHGSEEGGDKKGKARFIIFLPFPGYTLSCTLEPDVLLSAEQMWKTEE